jgi:hypothetical protein
LVEIAGQNYTSIKLRFSSFLLSFHGDESADLSSSVFAPSQCPAESLDNPRRQAHHHDRHAIRIHHHVQTRRTHHTFRLFVAAGAVGLRRPRWLEQARRGDRTGFRRVAIAVPSHARVAQVAVVLVCERANERTSERADDRTRSSGQRQNWPEEATDSVCAPVGLTSNILTPDFSSISSYAHSLPLCKPAPRMRIVLARVVYQTNPPPPAPRRPAATHPAQPLPVHA